MKLIKKFTMLALLCVSGANAMESSNAIVQQGECSVTEKQTIKSVIADTYGQNCSTMDVHLLSLTCKAGVSQQAGKYLVKKIMSYEGFDVYFQVFKQTHYRTNPGNIVLADCLLQPEYLYLQFISSVIKQFGDLPLVNGVPAPEHQAAIENWINETAIVWIMYETLSNLELCKTRPDQRLRSFLYEKMKIVNDILAPINLCARIIKQMSRESTLVDKVEVPLELNYFDTLGQLKDYEQQRQATLKEGSGLAQEEIKIEKLLYQNFGCTEENVEFRNIIHRNLIKLCPEGMSVFFNIFVEKTEAIKAKQTYLDEKPEILVLTNILRKHWHEKKNAMKQVQENQ